MKRSVNKWHRSRQFGVTLGWLRELSPALWSRSGSFTPDQAQEAQSQKAQPQKAQPPASRSAGSSAPDSPTPATLPPAEVFSATSAAAVDPTGEAVRSDAAQLDAAQFDQDQSDAVRADSIQSDLDQADLAQSNGAPSDSAPIDLAQADSIQSDLDQVDRAQSNTAQADLAQADRAQPNAAPSDSVPIDLAQADRAQPNAASSDSVPIDLAQADSIQFDLDQADRAKPNAAPSDSAPIDLDQADRAQPNAAPSDSVQADRVRSSSAQPDSAQPDSAQTDRSAATPSRFPTAPSPRIHPLNPPTLPARLPPKKNLSQRWSLHRPLAFLVTISALTGFMGQRFYNQPGLDVGRKAPATILAPESVTIEDTKTTEEQRKAARTGAIPVLKADSSTTQQIYADLQRWIDQAALIRQSLGPFPTIPFNQVSAPVQYYLREVDEKTWLEIVETVNRSRSSTGEPTPLTNLPPFNTPPSLPTASPTPTSASASSAKAQAIATLTRYRNTHPTEDYVSLLRSLFQARENYQTALATLVTERQNFAAQRTETPSLLSPPLVYEPEFLKITDKVWEDTQMGVYRALENILTQGIAPGTPPDLLDRAVRVQLRSAVIPAAGEPLAVDLLVRVLRPNLIQDAERTKLLAEQAAEAVEPVYVSIRAGEPIIELGDEITQAQFVLLDHFNKSERSANLWGLVGYGVIVSGGVGVFVLTASRFHPKMRKRDRVLILFLVLSTPVLALSKPLWGMTSLEISSLPAVGILMGSFYGSTLGSVTVGLLAVFLPLGLNVDPNILISSAASGLVAAQIAGRLRSREELALLGAGVGLTQALVQLLLSLSFNAAAGPVWSLLLQVAATQGLQGLAWCIVALGLSPYLEHLFDLVTPIRLAELSNPNRPLLQRLASETPGTFQHTLFVSTLAEAAARALRCNVELVRAGTLYHDIGKMHDPQGFIENQMGGTNKHDEINDPWKSADIIKKHVSEGLVMARRCRLPGSIQAFIPEHQGTMLIAYFHHQAQQLYQQDPQRYPFREEDFRYPGPIPQSRETGIVMLADSCEAALRSLKDATPEAALAMVRKIIRGRWQDQQLVDSGLKREEMDKIAEVFVQIWQQFHHKRIPYPSGINPVLSRSPVSPPPLGINS